MQTLLDECIRGPWVAAARPPARRVHDAVSHRVRVGVPCTCSHKKTASPSPRPAGSQCFTTPSSAPRSQMDIRGDVDPRKDSGGSPIARSGLYCMSCLANWVMYVSCQPRRFRDVFESRLASVSLLPLYQRCARTPRCHILMSLYIWGLRSPRAVLPRVIANQVAITLRLGVCVLGERLAGVRIGPGVPPRDSACT